MTDLPKLKAEAMERAVEALWIAEAPRYRTPADWKERLTHDACPNTESLCEPYYFMAQAAISAHNAFIKEAVKEDDVIREMAVAIAKIDGMTPEEYGYPHLDQGWAYITEQAQAANKVNIYRAIVCGGGG